MERFSERLKNLCKEAGVSRESLAYLCSVKEGYIENIETEYMEPDITILERLSQIFGVSQGYMAMLTNERETKEPEAKEVYVVKDIHSHDGVIRMSDIVGMVYMEKDDMHGKEYFALEVKDNSMSRARIMKGDVLMVRKQAEVKNADIVVARINNSDMIVRRYLRRGNTVILTSEGEGENVTLELDAVSKTFEILGKVCENRIINM